jgi:osmotically-inducible protein OsmY
MKHILFLAMLSLPLAAQQAPPPDNSKVNERDRNSSRPTADEQGNSKQDVERTTSIRKAIVDQKDLSTYAQNVKVITKNNKVTLRGPVRDQHERELIGKLAADVAGMQNVKNELEIAPKN